MYMCKQYDNWTNLSVPLCSLCHASIVSHTKRNGAGRPIRRREDRIGRIGSDDDHDRRGLGRVSMSIVVSSSVVRARVESINHFFNSFVEKSNGRGFLCRSSLWDTNDED